MKQIFAKYQDWEDYKAGMYSTDYKNEEILVSDSIKMLSNTDLFFHTCIDLIQDWTVSASVNLTNKSCNRKAWLGQAACCYAYNVPEICTRIAWGKLSNEQQIDANIIADKVIRIYENQNRRLYSNMGETLLF